MHVQNICNVKRINFHSFFPSTFAVVPFKELYMFFMFCLAPKSGQMVASDYTMANTLFSWKMEQKLLDTPPLPFWADGDGKL